MKKLALTLGVASLLPTIVLANEPDFYGKANVSWQNVSEDDENYTEIISNASRLGVKGEVAIKEGFTGIYQAEVEVDIDGDGDELFKERNTFVGIKGDFGQVIAGYFDTPLKKAQKKVDLFNDLEGDIKSVITRSDNRGKNSIQYTTPSFAGVKVAVDVINSENENVDNGISASIAYSNEMFYVAAGRDQDVEGENIDVTRFVGQIYLGKITLGALVEADETDNETDSETNRGQLVSIAFNASEKWVIKGQAGNSDIKKQDATTFSLGADYKVAKNAKFFGYLTSESYDGANENEEIDNSYVGIGLELKF